MMKFIRELFRSCDLDDIKDSAGGSAKQGRDPATQAIIPIRGKIINVEKEDLQKVLKNEEIKSIINAIGAGFLDTFDIKKMRYGKIIIATDSDIDGYHIRTLLTTFFFRFMPELIEAGKLYSANPPLYRIIQGKNIYYCRTDKDKDEKLKELNNKGINNYDITRFKGLGELNPKDLFETTLNPENFVLTRITMSDRSKADEVISGIMGNNANTRKEIIRRM